MPWKPNKSMCPDPDLVLTISGTSFFQHFQWHSFVLNSYCDTSPSFCNSQSYPQPSKKVTAKLPGARPRSFLLALKSSDTALHRIGTSLLTYLDEALLRKRQLHMLLSHILTTTHSSTRSRFDSCLCQEVIFCRLSPLSKHGMNNRILVHSRNVFSNTHLRSELIKTKSTPQLIHRDLAARIPRQRSTSRLHMQLTRLPLQTVSSGKL
jgi:hypothetical protein